MTPRDGTYIFGYGSLLRRLSTAYSGGNRETPCHLSEYRRGWDVAMDNSRIIRGYKYYVDPHTGERPAVYVTFLNIRRVPGSHLNGVAFPIAGSMLPALDLRERNYERLEVTELLDVDLGGRVWAYVGGKEGRDRFLAGARAGTAVVSRQYFDKVRADFASLGAAMLGEFDRTTDPLKLPLRSLDRIDVPTDALAADRTENDGDEAAGAPWAVEGGA